jgi:hypothetical protein
MEYDNNYMTFISGTCLLMLILFGVKIVTNKEYYIKDLQLDLELELDLELDLEKNDIESSTKNEDSFFLETSKNPVIFHLDDMGNDFITDSYYYVGLNQGDKCK